MPDCLIYQMIFSEIFDSQKVDDEDSLSLHCLFCNQVKVTNLACISFLYQPLFHPHCISYYVPDSRTQQPQTNFPFFRLK